MSNVYIEGYGCSHNLSDTEKLRGYFGTHGFQLVESPVFADIVIINTCAVKVATENKMMRRIKQLNTITEKSNARLIVFGCLPRINSKRLQKEFPRLLALGPSLKELTLALHLPEQEFTPALSELPSNKHIAVLPVSTGCLNQCAFCSVWIARGKIKSYSISELTQKFQQSLSYAKEIWLTGEDLGCYGMDSKTNLIELLKALLTVPGNYRIRLGMMNPQWVKKFSYELTDLFVHDKRLYCFLHIPLQSGSNSVLARMHRGYTVEDFLEIVQFFRSRVPGIAIATDIIVGFPDESEKEFRETVQAIEQSQMDITNISKFGIRPGSFAEQLKGQLPERIKTERSRILTQLCKRISIERNRSLIHSDQIALITQEAKKGFLGRTFNYKPVILTQDVRGSFVRVHIVDAGQNYLKSEYIEILP